MSPRKNTNTNTAATKAAPKRSTRKKNESAKLLDAVSKLDAQTVIDEVGQLQSNLQGTLAGLSATISTKIEQMKQVDEAIDLKENRLKELFDIENESMNIEAVRELKEKEDEEYQKSCEKRDADWAEQENTRSKNWQREKEEHDYIQEQRIKRFNDEFTAQLASTQRQEKVRKEELEREWADREKALKDKENEFQNLKDQVAQFDAKLKTEVSKAEAVVGNKMKRDYEHQMQLVKLDAESTKKLFDAEKVSLNNTIASLSDQIDNLERQLSEAHKDAKEVVSAALDSASGRKAAEAVQKAIESTSSSKK